MLTMKKISLLFAALCLIASTALAQTQLKKGNMMLGITSTISMDGGLGSELMSLGFTKTKNKDGSDPAEDAYKCTSYNFLPKTGHFIMDNLAVGLEAVIGGYKEKGDNDYDTWSESMFGIGPFARYYYPQEKYYPFGEIEALFGSQKSAYNDNDYKSGFVMLGIYLGVAVPLGEKVTFDAEAGYGNITYTHKGTGVEDVDYKNITGGLLIKTGFTVYLIR
ncbi:MAG: hypothetical protein E4G92_06035 [Bacteroidia bacterium]|nr:MAG: hypothetical protein E4G92_06035 [Bacteroidia bacterium]